MNDRSHAAQSTSSQLQQLQMQLQLERQQANVARQQQIERGSSVGANRRSKTGKMVWGLLFEKKNDFLGQTNVSNPPYIIAFLKISFSWFPLIERKDLLTEAFMYITTF